MVISIRTILLLIVFPFISRAQYLPTSAQPFQFAPAYNPAFTGIENFSDLKLGYRYQWTAFKENAPKFVNLSYNMRIKQPLDLKVNALRTSQTDFASIVPRRKLNIQGLGGTVFSESYGLINRVGGGVHYALHMPLIEKIFLSGGAGLTLENTRLKQEEIYLGEFAQEDPFIENLRKGSANHSELWLRLGFLLYSENFYLGAAYYPWSTSVATSEVAFDNPFYKGNFQGGISFPLNEDFTLKPSIFALWQVDGKWVVDYAAKFFLQDKAWVGLTYRDVKSGIGSAGFNINELLSASYSFEFALGKLRTFSGGTHEINLALRLHNLKRVNQYTW